ncbi:hypothetical protein XENOCAPTIV_009414, partial [Xenoophorus captivus]
HQTKPNGRCTAPSWSWEEASCFTELRNFCSIVSSTRCHRPLDGWLTTWKSSHGQRYSQKGVKKPLAAVAADETGLQHSDVTICVFSEDTHCARPHAHTACVGVYLK